MGACCRKQRRLHAEKKQDPTVRVGVIRRRGCSANPSSTGRESVVAQAIAARSVTGCRAIAKRKTPLESG